MGFIKLNNPIKKITLVLPRLKYIGFNGAILSKTNTYVGKADKALAAPALAACHANEGWVSAPVTPLSSWWVR